MLKSSSMIIPKSILIKIKYVGRNNYKIWLFGPMATVKVTLGKIASLLSYYRLLIINFNFSEDTLKNKMAYCESVAHLLKFAFINVNKSYMCYIRVKGVGYKIERSFSNALTVNLGYSHKINVKIPSYIKICVLKKRTIV
jgi:ribosomal protein L6P/L9E